MNWPDLHIQLSSVAVHKTYSADLSSAFNLQDMTPYYNDARGKPSFTLAVINSRPVARGEVSPLQNFVEWNSLLLHRSLYFFEHSYYFILG